MSKQDPRFEVVHKEGNELKRTGTIMIFKDKETGVHYLVNNIGYGTGITALRDSEGNVFIEK